MHRSWWAQSGEYPCDNAFMSVWLRAGDEQAPPRRKVLLYCLAIASAATAVIHFAVAGSHFQQYWLYGAFMLVVPRLHPLWAVGAVARPARCLLWARLVLNAAALAASLLTRPAPALVCPVP